MSFFKALFCPQNYVSDANFFFSAQSSQIPWRSQLLLTALCVSLGMLLA